jgi:hypothetical protein
LLNFTPINTVSVGQFPENFSRYPEILHCSFLAPRGVHPTRLVYTARDPDHNTHEAVVAMQQTRQDRVTHQIPNCTMTASSEGHSRHPGLQKAVIPACHPGLRIKSGAGPIRDPGLLNSWIAGQAWSSPQ